MLVEAWNRIDGLKVTHANATLYGDVELGGLHVLFVLDDTPATYGLPPDPKVPAAAVAWQGVLQPVGYAVAGLVAGGLLVNYMVARARKIKEKEGS